MVCRGCYASRPAGRYKLDFLESGASVQAQGRMVRMEARESLRHWIISGGVLFGCRVAQSSLRTRSQQLRALNGSDIVHNLRPFDGACTECR